MRNTRGVTGFVGPGSEPIPLTEAEMRSLGIADIISDREAPIVIDVEEGDSIEVISGAWEGTQSTVLGINQTKQTVTIEVEMFAGQATSVEIGFTEIKKM